MVFLCVPTGMHKKRIGVDAIRFLGLTERQGLSWSRQLPTSRNPLSDGQTNRSQPKIARFWLIYRLRASFWVLMEKKFGILRLNAEKDQFFLEAMTKIRTLGRCNGPFRCAMRRAALHVLVMILAKKCRFLIYFGVFGL